MAIKYICRHCQSVMGELDSALVNEYQLGLHFLTPEERSDIITYSPNGDMTVKVVCEYCKQALESNPELALVANPLQ